MSIELSLTNLINFFGIATGIGVCVLFLFLLNDPRLQKDVRRYFSLFFISVTCYLLFHMTRMMMEGLPGTVIRYALIIVTILEFTVSGIMTFLISIMILYIANPEKAKKGLTIFLLTVTAIHIILLVISQFTDLFYYFDGDNIYHRSNLYSVSNLPSVLMLLLDIYLLIRYRSKYEPKTLRAFWIYMIAPLAGIILQLIFPQIQFLIFATTIAGINMFVTIISVLSEQYQLQQTENARLETELSMAKRIQADMLPNIFPAFPERTDFDIYASMDPAKEVGGDFYDFFLLDDDHLAIVMADVSGKGVPAAMFMMISKILVQNYTLVGNDPKEALEAVNEQICKNNREEMFVTVWLGILDLTSGKLVASNAGHEYPVMKTPNGKFELIRDKHGFVIGGMEGVKFKEYELIMEKGAKLFLYTDGVPEATDIDNVQFGTDRMLESLNESANDTPEQIIKHMDESIKKFIKEAPQFDDCTMLCIEYNGK